MMLADVVNVARRFQRSIRVDTDLGAANALQGFICHGSGRAALATMARLIVESGQRAFTWTGPYGGGKSSLALALCAYLSSDTQLRKLAQSFFVGVPYLSEAFPSNEMGWLVLPVVGRRNDPVEDLNEALAAAASPQASRRQLKRRRTDKSGREFIAQLQAEAEARPHSGVLVLLDEMSKFLEGAAAEGSDIQFFQELAEAAGRCQGRLVVIGILHQAFEQYASQLGREARDEWAKIQGRYVDIPVVTATDEVIDLLGRAVDSDIEHPESLPIAKEVAEAIQRRRPGSPDDLAERLDRCWPLHPVVAVLLGPVSRHRFGQNERSTFGFLGSSEPGGFQEFLRSTPVIEKATYDPAQFWDYLRINLEPAILASPDGHRWAQGAEAIERCEAKGSSLHIGLSKTIALIDLFRNGSGLVPEQQVLYASFANVVKQQIDQALEDLEHWSIIIFRKHLDAWAIYAGSDFDIDEAVKEALTVAPDLDLGRLSRLAGLQPILAKQHYHRTGTLRWLETDLVQLNQLKDVVSSFTPKDGSAGKFVLTIPDADDDREAAKIACWKASEFAGTYPVAVGLPRNAWKVRELGADLIALETVRTTRPELEGDSVARREIAARIAATSAQLEEALRVSFREAIWYVRKQIQDIDDLHTLSHLVSTLADETFADAPVVHSELINREKPSSNSQAAVRQLLYAMVEQANKPYLGIKGFPAERGLYSTVLEVAGLHRILDDGSLGFAEPSSEGPGASFQAMWSKAEEIFADAEDLMPLSALYEAWSEPPFGIRRGVLPVLAMAFIQAHRSSLAVYAEGMFRPEVDRYVVDLLLQSEDLIALRWVNLESQNKHILQKVANAIAVISGEKPEIEPLSVARNLVRFIFQLPAWTRRTTSLSDSSQAVRHIFLNASDPHQALFIDLPIQFEGTAPDSIGARIGEALCELADAYPSMLNYLRDRMFAALDHKGEDLQELHHRAQVVSNLSGDLRLDAFATRLSGFTGTTEDMEGIAGMAINKPARDWSDRDPDRAALALAELALKFRQAETFARVKGREPTQHALAVVFGTGEAGRTLMEAFDISEFERTQVSTLANAIVDLLHKSGADRRLVLAALAEAGIQVVDESIQLEPNKAGKVALP